MKVLFAVDDEVTDPKLRVASGSTSKWSGSFHLNYSGASLHQPFADERPQVGIFSYPDPVSASGNLGFRYRKDKNKSFYIATGFYRGQPFSSRDQFEKEIEFNTPSLTYNNTFALGDLQIGSSLSSYLTTLNTARDIGELMTLGYNLSALKTIESQKVTAGVNFYAWYTYYKNGFDEYKTSQLDYGLSFGPQVQYNWTDRLNTYASLSPLNFQHFKNKEEFNFKKGPTTASTGFGWAIQRDIYFSPYVSFKPSSITNKTVNLNFLLSINLF